MPRTQADAKKEEGQAFLWKILQDPDNAKKMDFYCLLKNYIKSFDLDMGKEKNQEKKNKEKKDKIINMVAMILFAGFESTSTALFFTLLLAADKKHEDTLQKLTAEVHKAWDGKTPLTKELTDNMPLLSQFIEWSLAMYPPFPDLKDELDESIDLSAGTEEKLPGLPKGTIP